MKLASDAGKSGHGRMDVRILEAGRHRPAAELDVARAGADEAPHIAVASDGYDAAVAQDDQRVDGLGDAVSGSDQENLLLMTCSVVGY